jgi:aspartate/methionine/tyrosine aminotransferase
MVASPDQLHQLAAIAARHEVPLIADEVFSEFLFSYDTAPRPAFTDAPLVFTLNGLSKMFALPGMKIGWIGVSGNAHLVERAISALELISDTFLPVNEIAQFAVPQIFARGREFLERYKAWISQCRNIAVDCLSGCTFAAPEGGFYLTLRLSSDEEQAALRLLQEDHILVHPGYFYDIAPHHLVMTFVHDPLALRKAFTAIAARARE